MVVGIVGLGLMGGSMGLAVKNLEFIDKVVGIDHNQSHCESAISLNLVDEIVDWEGLKQSDVIFLAIPVEGIINSLKNLIDIPPNTTIIDLGSTKAKIVENIPTQIRKNFIAAHPMTGTEKFGPTAALKNLYKDKIVVLCNLDESGEHQCKIAWRIFEEIGMKIVTMDAKEHDRHAAYISHLPHAISYALANAVMAQEDAKNILILAAGGFRDMSRLAKSSPVMWEEIFKQNKNNLLEAMDHFEEELKRCRELINNEEWESLHYWMKDANKLHDIL
ncbi:prephenate dehydrogenase [Hydrogenimonas thermophila]|uniref:prephenate dehydrogenase n=1 Tax=Hydrogenimonas thermophila TaxID=223786 RepID=UPI002937484B|nr:prephenate dehydrogenase [Hydrogenimonas thermophila]WOE70407.1 prephenate dehydrogenase [Hydrogenimonas thermophila]WOE72922.1 prephenate dehydrogenase [Hydrogenimonas thermophila]